MADSSQPSEGAELSLRPQGRKSIGESYIVHDLRFWGKSLAALSSEAVGHLDHYSAKIKLPSRCDLRFSGKSLGDSSLCERGGWVSSTKTMLKLISPVHKLCGFGSVSVNLICVPAFRCNCGYRSSINICLKAFSFQTSPCLEMSIKIDWTFIIISNCNRICDSCFRRGGGRKWGRRRRWWRL